MNPVALQLAGAKREPLAPTSWGAFGPHWLWVSPTDAGVAISAVPAVVTVTAQAVSPTLAGLAIDAAPAAITVTAQAVDPTLSALAVDAEPAIINVTAMPALPMLTGDAIVFYSCGVFAPSAVCEIV